MIEFTDRTSAAHPTSLRSHAMITAVSDIPASANDLRHKLADLLRDQNTVRSPAVDAALRSVPRHLFLPGVSLQEAYANAERQTVDAMVAELVTRGVLITTLRPPLTTVDGLVRHTWWYGWSRGVTKEQRACNR